MIKKTAAFVSLILVSVAGISAQNKAPLPRSASFFGPHYDLHPNDQDPNLGADVTEEMIRGLMLM